MSEKMTIDDFFKDTGGKKTKKSIETPKENETKAKKESVFKVFARTLLERIHVLRNPEFIYDDNPVSTVKQTAFRVIFWVVVLILLIKGIFSAVMPVRPIVKEYVIKQEASEGDAAKAFALQFAREYMTYDQDKLDDYKKRVNKYSNDGALDNREGKSRVIEANVFSIKKIDGKKSVVTIFLKVLQQKAKAKEVTKEIYLKVPVYVNDNSNYVVQEMPVFDIPFEKAEPFYKENVSTIPDQVRKEIKETLENFFKIYDRGTEEQISYFFKPAQKLKGYENMFHFLEISSMELYDSKTDKNEVAVSVTVNLKDDIGSVFRQKFNMLMVKDVKDKESRWYIEKMLDSIYETINKGDGIK